MKIRVALVGELTDDRLIFGGIDFLLGQISCQLCKNNEGLELLISPSYTGGTWTEMMKLHDFSVCTYNMRGSADYVDACARVVRMDTSLRVLLGEAMCDKADVMVVAWNEDVTEASGATWEFMRIAYEKKAPCIWISTRTRATYCLWDAYYKEYTPQYLEAVCEPLQAQELLPVSSDERTGRVLAFWEKRRGDYLKKYKADAAVHPSEEDDILKPDFKLEEEAAGGEEIWRILFRKFNQFDSAAITWNSKFQAMIYQSSVLPFLTTIFLAIGSYAEKLIGAISPPNFVFADAVATFARALAGIGFLVYGCLNLYVYRLSKSRRIHGWQESFVKNRYVAEILRILIHFLPYGVQIDLRRLCGEDKKMFMMLKHLTDDAEPARQEMNQKTVLSMLGHVKGMLEDQLAYHEASAKRYKALVTSLEKWGRKVFYAGFVMVLGCGLLQFALLAAGLFMDIDRDFVDIGRNMLNMLALVLPAWAVYFSTKAQENNFAYNYENHRNMISRLRPMRERVSRFIGQGEISMEMFSVMVEELVEMMVVDDSSRWQYHYMNSTVKPL